MKNYRKPRQEENTSRRARRASQKKVMLAGWIFLGVMLIAAVAAIILLLPGRDKTPDTEDLFCEHLAVFSETWPTSVSMRKSSVYARPTWAPATDDSACSYLPTPTAQDFKNVGTREAF